MSITFLTEADLAEVLGVNEDLVKEWRRTYAWPHIRIGRNIRFTEADVKAIAAQHRAGGKKRGTALPDQTGLSIARSS